MFAVNLHGFMSDDAVAHPQHSFNDDGIIRWWTARGQNRTSIEHPSPSGGVRR